MKYTIKEQDFINSLNKPIDKININLINSIINKMIKNKEYEELIYFLNNLYDFTIISIDIVNKIIIDNNKECASFFLENEEILFFLNKEEKNKLKSFLNVFEVNIKLNESYNYYYDLLFNQEIRLWKSINIDNYIEYSFTKNNKLIKIKLKEIKDLGLFVSYINYNNYNLSKEEQILNGIDYINKYGFNINKDVNNILNF